MFKKARITLLLFVLFLVAAGSWLHQKRLTDWNGSLWAEIYPIAGDSTATTRNYIRRLREDRFKPIETFIASQANEFGMKVRRPVKLILRSKIDELPPEPPTNGSVLSVMIWSLQLRYWAWTHESDDLLGDVSLFVIYHDPERSPSVPHSLGIKEGSIGVVHAFASEDMTQSNNVVITHEFLHTLGATDKYDPQSNLPLYPAGFAEPRRAPLYPQDQAEIMAGRIPVSSNEALIPRSLKQTIVGSITAEEIGW